MEDKIKTGYVYDPIFLDHNRFGHPENRKRLEAVMDELIANDLLSVLTEVKPRRSISETLEMCHTRSYIDQVRRASNSGEMNLDPDTYVNYSSFDAACLAVDGLIELTDKVLSGTINNGFAFLRPPGHHAMPDRAMGFCLFGNVAAAAKYAREIGGLDKVAIIDFDVHHGNGTQAITDNDPGILFISTHQYPLYPGTGIETETGKGNGKGSKVNIPLPAGSGDEGFKLVYNNIVLPLLYRNKPEAIFVSAGYDAHWIDPLAGLNLSLEGFNFISNTLVSVSNEICGGRIIFSLEGGYDLTALKNGVANSVRALLGRENFSDPLGKAQYYEPDISELLKRVKEIHRL